jgi:hypothetical protein
MDKYVSAGADISPDGLYRYRLWREWRGGLEKNGHSRDGGKWGQPKSILFVMLNPSTADGAQDDPTIRRCVAFAKSWGYDRMEVVNLFAYRATKPDVILAMGDADDPFGDRNTETVKYAAWDADVIVCAWGAHGGHLGQDETVRGWMEQRGKPLMALGFTAGGHPRHPLYVKSDSALVRMPRQRGGRAA